jgi:hypothetical protein
MRVMNAHRCRGPAGGLRRSGDLVGPVLCARLTVLLGSVLFVAAYLGMAAPVVLIGLLSRTMELVVAGALIAAVVALIGLTALAAVLRTFGVSAASAPDRPGPGASQCTPTPRAIRRSRPEPGESGTRRRTMRGDRR